MRKLILGMSVSLDGFVAGPNGETDWIFRNPDPKIKDWIHENLWEAGVHIMGSRSYQVMAPYWPTSPDLLAAPMNQIPKVIFSKSGVADLQAAIPAEASEDASTAEAIRSWRDARIASGDLAEEILQLKSEPGKDIVAHGGALFARSLAASGLIDEYRLMIHPVALGQGLSLFASLAEPLNLRLTKTVSFDSGRILHVYVPDQA